MLMYALLIVVGYAQMIVPSSENYILNENDQQVLNTEDIENPLREWAYNIIVPVEWTGTLSWVVWSAAGEKIDSFEMAKNRTMQVIKNAINYALGMLWLVALVYLIYHGFIMLTAAGDDSQYKKGLKGIKFAAIAIIGIWLSRFIVSGIFRLIDLIITT